MDYIPRAILDKAYQRLGRSALKDRLHAVRALGDVRGERYMDERGRARIIDISLKPWILTSKQLYHFHCVIQHLAAALIKLPKLYASVPAAREAIHFSKERIPWLSLTGHSKNRPMAVMGRMDATAIYDIAGWAHEYQMLEPNAVGVGGIHYGPTANEIVMQVGTDVLTQALPGRVITATPDPRQLLLEELQAVARRAGIRLRAIALIENTDYMTGTDEFNSIADYLNRCGLKAVVCDPRHLRWIRGKLYAKKTPVDLLYRDSELVEFIEMERKGKKLDALRQTIKEGRLVSSLDWEFDQKSAWEIFTDSRFAKYFSAAQQRIFRERLLWTRMVRHAKVTDLSGRMIDLPKYIRSNQDRLVLKPNTLFGGEGVVIGKLVGKKVWERELQRALHARQRYVVQQLAKIHEDTLPLLVKDKPCFESRSVVSGFFFNSYGIGLVGRFSSNPVVNVSRGGGLIGSLWVH